MTAPTTAECEELAEWLRREMPAGTVIGNPDWWAKRIAARANAALLAVAAERDANYDLLTKAGRVLSQPYSGTPGTGNFFCRCKYNGE